LSGRVVIDASAAVRIVMEDANALALAEVLEESAIIWAPEIFCPEVANALWKYVRAGHLSLEEAQEKLSDALSLASMLAPTQALVEEALAEAVSYSHSVYDLFYLVLARRQSALIVTADRRLASLAEQMRLRFFLPPS
jgi:predicted nucleic acid-binding protein